MCVYIYEYIGIFVPTCILGCTDYFIDIHVKRWTCELLFGFQAHQLHPHNRLIKQLTSIISAHVGSSLIIHHYD